MHRALLYSIRQLIIFGRCDSRSGGPLFGRGGGDRTRVQIYLTPTFSAPCVSDASDQLTTFDDLHPFGLTSRHDIILRRFNLAGITSAVSARWSDDHLQGVQPFIVERPSRLRRKPTSSQSFFNKPRSESVVEETQETLLRGRRGAQRRVTQIAPRWKLDFTRSRNT